jgi:hypothetical protein
MLIKWVLGFIKSNIGCFGFIAGVIVTAIALPIIFSTNALTGLLRNFDGFFTPYTPPANIYIPEVEPFTELNELVTITYNYSQLIVTSTDMPAALQTLYGTNLSLVAVGHIAAGINMNELIADDLQFNPETNQLTIRLPAPVLTTCFLDDQQTYVADRRSGVFAVDNANIETSSRRFALEQFRLQAIESGILNEAQTRAIESVQNLAQALFSARGQNNVTVLVQVDPMPAQLVLPATCR